MKARSAALGIVVALLIAQPASASTASSQQMRDLASRAMSDPGALAELRGIDVVDGKPVDIATALDHATRSELASRLETLAHGLGSGPAGTTARSQAREILSGRRFREASLPRPFAGVLNRIGRALSRIFRPIIRHIPGGDSVFWIMVGLLVVGLAVFITYRLGRRRRVVESDYARSIRTKALRPEDLERAAREAEAAGRAAEAIRLRFAAGLIRLDRAGVIEWHPSITSGSVRRRLRSGSFDQVASSFERVTYGNRAPTPDDLELSKAGWRDVLEHVA